VGVTDESETREQHDEFGCVLCGGELTNAMELDTMVCDQCDDAWGRG
jgi:hypothetical protein